MSTPGVVALLLGMGLVALFGVLLPLRPWEWPGPTHPARTDAASIVRVLGGGHGKYRASYTYQVRLDSGSEGEATLSDLLSPGTRIRLTYNRGHGNRLNVHSYQACQGDCR